MLCKFCNQEVEEGLEFCPFCGKKMMEEITPEPEDQVVAEVSTEEQVSSATSVEKQQESMPEQEQPKEAPKQKRSVLPLILSIVAAVAALGALAVVLLIAMGVDFKPRENDIFYREAYTVDAEKAEKKNDMVVATMGDKELTNVQLQLYYRMQVIDLLNYYGSYASQIGLDYTKPLSEQTCYFDNEQTWEQYMIGVAIETWQRCQALGLLAEEEGFTLNEEWEATLAQVPEDLLTQAKEQGFDSADELLSDVIRLGCTEADYMEYIRLSCLSNAFYGEKEAALTPNQADIDAYYAANEETFTQQGITKDMGMISDVRHILIMPTGGIVDEETGVTSYSEEEWAVALKKAEEVLQEWKDGEMTEDSFALLANTYSEDGGSNTTGGLYEDIEPGASYVENFLNWSVDMDRQVGETDIVKTEYGYHIMYYVGGEPYWSQTVSTQLLSERITELTDSALEKWETKIDYRKIFLGELNLE